MSNEPRQDPVVDPKHDESFWASLFQLEEAEKEVEYFEPPTFIDDVISHLEEPITPLDHREVEAISKESGDPWARAREAMLEDQTFTLRVIGHNKGGLLVNWDGIQGFVPASQLIDLPQFHLPRERMQALAGWHDRLVSLKVIEVDKAQSRLIFSERATLVPAQEREGLLSGVQPGARLIGTVTNLTSFGAFVDLGGVEGLIHISEISWSRVIHPSAVLKPGQSVQVLVLDVNQGEERVALSMKRLRPDPWEGVEQRYRPGQFVSGIVGNITTFGAFVQIEPELEGLVHISELAEGAFLHPRDVVHSGEEVVARVLAVDGPGKRLALTLRGVRQPGEAGQ